MQPPRPCAGATVTVRDVADDAVLISADIAPGDVATDWVLGIQKAIRALSPPWLRHAQPAYTSLQVVFDADVDADVVKAALASLSPLPWQDDVTHHVLDVDYGGAHGPDLEELADSSGLSVDDVVIAHSAPTYRVAFMGFVPGFPYLLGLDPRLAMPRLTSPRPAVPAGSVAVAGEQAGIYPTPSPGGWRLVGRLAGGKSPTFRPGDTVRFRAAAQGARL